jgi:hypothetical protein
MVSRRAGLEGAAADTERVALASVVHEIDRMLAAKAPPARTVRVRVAVAVAANGDWLACGADRSDEWAVARVEYDPGDRLTWVTADVPLPPEPAEVEGEVE